MPPRKQPSPQSAWEGALKQAETYAEGFARSFFSIYGPESSDGHHLGTEVLLRGVSLTGPHVDLSSPNAYLATYIRVRSAHFTLSVADDPRVLVSCVVS